MTKAVKKIMAIDEVIVTILFAISVLLVMAQVFWRYVLGDPITWSSQISRALFCWMTYLGIPILFNRNILMSFDLVENSFSEKGQAILKIIFRLIGLFFCVCWFYFSYVLCTAPTTVGKSFPGLLPIITALPKNALYISQPICCVLLFLVQLSQIFEIAGGMKKAKKEGK